MFFLFVRVPLKSAESLALQVYILIHTSVMRIKQNKVTEDYLFLIILLNIIPIFCLLILNFPHKNGNNTLLPIITMPSSLTLISERSFNSLEAQKDN